MKVTWFILLTCIILLLPLTVSDSPEEASSLNIKHIGWVVTKKTGVERNLTFWTLNSSDKKTHLGWIPINNDCNGWVDQYLYYENGSYILDDKDKEIQLKCESSKCNGMNCYHIALTDAASVNIDDYVQLGNNTIATEYQDINMINYQSEWFDLNVTLFINETNGSSANDIWIRHDDNKDKFGANVSLNETTRFKYVINSTEHFFQQSDLVYYIKKNYEDMCGNISCTKEERHYLNFDDICTIQYENCSTQETEGECDILFDPECSFELTNSIHDSFHTCDPTEPWEDCNKVSNLEITFYGMYNSTLGIISIDPSITIEDVSSADSTLVNVTTENNFTHLTINDDDIIVHYTFDTNISQTTLYDYSQYNNDGTYNNDARYDDSGLIGGAGYFDGGADVSIADSTSLDSITYATWSAWIYPTSLAGYNTVIAKAYDTAWWFGLYTGTGQIQLWVSSEGHQSVSAVTVNEWSHIVATWNATTIKYYINGAYLSGEDDTSSAGVDTNNALAHIGADYNSGPTGALNYWFSGYIDDVMIINRTLNSSEISDLYNNQSSRYYPSGTQTFEDNNITEGDLINVSINSTVSIDSSINVSVGNNAGGSYSYGSQYSFTNDVALNIPVTTPTNFSLRFHFYPSTGNFLSSILMENVYIESYSSNLPTYNNFNGSTTDFSSEPAITAVTDAILENTTQGMINFSGHTLNFSNLDLDSYVIMENGSIYVNTSGPGITNLNVSAILTFYNIPGTYPIVYRNGQICDIPTCNDRLYDGTTDTLRINVSNFDANFTVQEWDTNWQCDYYSNVTTGYVNISNKAEGLFPANSCANLKFSALDEASGLQRSIQNPGVYWSHQDNSGDERLIAINESGYYLGSWNFSLGTSVDIEDIMLWYNESEDQYYIYLMDVGDNGNDSVNIWAYRAKEPYPVSNTVRQAPFENNSFDVVTYTMSYPGGLQHKDIESTFADPLTGDWYFVLKRTSPAQLYKASFPHASSFTLEYVKDLPWYVPGGVLQATAADITEDGHLITVRRDDANVVHVWPRPPGQDIDDIDFYETICNITNVIEPQGEAIAFADNDGSFYTLSEAAGTCPSPVPVYYWQVNSTAEPADSINMEISYPTTSHINVTQNEFFNVSFNITCHGTCGEVNVTLDPPNWWNDSWGMRKEIYINQLIAAVISSYPMFINISYEAEMQPDYDDIRILNGNCDAATTQLPFEVENYTAERSHVWVRLSNLIAGGQYLCVYYGNDAASSNATPNDVWHERYVWVQHLQEASDPRYDSTQYGNNCSMAAGTLPAVDGIVGRAGNFTSNNNWLDCGNSRTINLTGNKASWEAWIQLANPVVTGTYYILRKDDAYVDDISIRNTGWLSTDGYYSPNTRQEVVYHHSTTWDTEWHHVAGVWNGATQYFQLYLDGELVNTTILSSSNNFKTSVNAPMLIGAYNSGNYFEGLIDEARVYNNTLTSQYMNATYQLIANHNNYVTYGEGESYGKGGIISTVPGTEPFYTNASSNPLNLTFVDGVTQTVTFWVNATGNINSSYLFFGYANLTSNISVGNITTEWNITIVNVTEEEVSVIGLETLYPTTTEINVTQNEFFNVSFNVFCLEGSCGEINLTLDPVGWWDNNWGSRKEINITNVGTTTLTYFPSFINVSYDSDMRANYSDLRFINGSCNSGQSRVLAYEIGNYTTTSASVYVEIPNLYTGVNQICMYYNNPTASENENATGVWNSDYRGVYHLNDGAGVTEFNDSTQYNNYGNCTDCPPWNYTGIVGGAYDFDGVTGNGDAISTQIRDTFGDFTAEAWFKDDGDNKQYERILGKDFQTGFWLGRDNTNANTWRSGVREASAPYGREISLTDNQWHHIVTIRSGSTHYIYGDGGVVSNSGTVGNTALGTEDIVIGRRGPYSDTLQGGTMIIDEVRISNVSRSLDWVNQTYLMIDQQSTYVSFGAEEEGGKGDIISTVVGTTPFYTNISSNPYNFSLSTGEDLVVTFWVNATGEINETYEFFAYANLTSDISIGNITEEWNVTIVNVTLDTTDPVVTLDSPVDGGNVSTTTVTITCSATDDTGLANISLYINRSTNDGWQAFNDVADQSAGNVTNYQPGDSGLLVKYSDNTSTGVTLTATGGTVSSPQGSMPNAGTDAYNIFNGIIDFTGVNYYTSMHNYTFTGLNSSRRYRFVHGANRDNPPSYPGYNDRNTTVIILEADSFDTNSSIGIRLFTFSSTNDAAEYLVGNNTELGLAAGYTNIDPGADGRFWINVSSIRSPIRHYTNGLMLELLGEDEWYLNDTNVVTGTSNSTTFTLNLSDGDYKWNCLATDSSGNSAFATSNYTFTVETGPEVSFCRDLSTANTVYTLQNDISVDSSCINITANNVTLDCSNYELSDNNSASSIGILIDSYDDATVRNCVISNFTRGISGDTCFRLNITNNTIYDCGQRNNPGIGIYFTVVNDSSITYNNITNVLGEEATQLGSESDGGGIFFEDVTNTTISYNHIDGSFDNVSNTGSDYCIRIERGTINIISYNNLTDCYHNIFLESFAPFNVINYNNVTYGSSQGIYLTSSNNNLTGNNLSSNWWSFRLVNSDNNIIIDTTIQNCTAGTNECLSMSISDNNYFRGGIINNSAEQSLILLSESSNNTFQDYTLLNSADNDTYIRSSSLNNTFLNVSYNLSLERVDSSELIRQWYLEVYVNDSSGYGVTGVNVTGYNTSDSLQFYGLTQATNITERFNVTEYINTNGVRSYFTNYTVNVSWNNKVGTDQLNLTTNFLNDSFYLTIPYTCRCHKPDRDWIVDCADNCVVETDCNVAGNDIVFTNSGSFTVSSNITNIRNTTIINTCDIYLITGFSIEIIGN